MKFESKKLVISNISWDDIEDVHQLLSCNEIHEFNTLSIPHNIEDTRRFLTPLIDDKVYSKKHITWKVAIKQNFEFIGICGMELSLDLFKVGKIYFLINPRYWGYGYATELTKRIVNFAFKNLDIHRIEAGVVIDNIRSIRVLEKANMVQEGIRRKATPINGKWSDSFLYSILDDDKV